VADGAAERLDVRRGLANLPPSLREVLEVSARDSTAAHGPQMTRDHPQYSRRRRHLSQAPGYHALVADETGEMALGRNTFIENLDTIVGRVKQASRPRPCKTATDSRPQPNYATKAHYSTRGSLV